MLRLLLLAASAVAVLGGSSPHAEYIRETYKSTPGSRYSDDILEDATLDVPGLIAKYRYPVEVHEVTTSDGYILTMHRIPHGRDHNNQPGPRKVAFLMHGLVSSSADWVVIGPQNALAYILAEEGYDVWMGNARGNFYSRRHQRLNPNSILNQSFWRFSWDDIGNHDLPAFIDYILEVTQQPKIHYIGHSQGGTTFLVLNSLRPEYNEKFISFQGLAPASFFTHNDHNIFTSIAPMENIIETAAFAMGRGEVFGNREFLSWFSDNYCVEGSIFDALCHSVLTGSTSEHFNETITPLLLGHAPAGASVRQFAHYGQSIRFDSFRRYNYNGLNNMGAYGSWNPPEYDLSLITTPSYIHYGLSDTLVHPQDVEILLSRLPNLKESHLVASPSFDHIDFIWGIRVKDQLYNTVLKYMKEAEENL